nr:hypothetical protein [Proteus sp. ZN5]
MQVYTQLALLRLHSGILGYMLVLSFSAYQTKAGKAWDKDIYSAWKRHRDIARKLKLNKVSTGGFAN